MPNEDGKFGVTLNEGHTPLAEDEPVFVFRAQDQLMPSVLAYYAELCQSVGSPESHVSAIGEHRERVIAWQTINGCRVPD